MILALVVEDGMDFFGSRSTDVWAEHDQVGSLSVHVLRVKGTVKQLDVSTPTVNILLMLHRELENERLLLIRELWELGGNGVEVGILRSLDSCGRVIEFDN